MLQVNKLKVKMEHDQGQRERGHVFSQGFAQADSFTAEEGAERKCVPHLAIWS